MTFSVVLPRKALLSPLFPYVPMTIRSTPRPRAASTMALNERSVGVIFSAGTPSSCAITVASRTRASASARSLALRMAERKSKELPQRLAMAMASRRATSLCFDPSTAARICLYSIRAAWGTMRILQVALPMTFAATSPMNAYATPFQPRRPITIMSAFLATASATTAAAGEESACRTVSQGTPALSDSSLIPIKCVWASAT